MQKLNLTENELKRLLQEFINETAAGIIGEFTL